MPEALPGEALLLSRNRDDPLAGAQTIKSGELWLRGDLLILNAENVNHENACGCTEKVSRTHKMIPLRQITGVTVGYVNVKSPSRLVYAFWLVVGAVAFWIKGKDWADIDMSKQQWYFQFGPFILAALLVFVYYAGTESEMTLTIESNTTKMSIKYATMGSTPNIDSDEFRTCEAYTAAMTIDKARQDLQLP